MPRPDLKPIAGGLAALAMPRADVGKPKRAKPVAVLRERRRAVAVRDRTQHLATIVRDWRRDYPGEGLDIWTARGLDAADVLECLIERDGPFDLTACTFAVGEASIRRLRVLRDRGQLRRVVLLCDALMFSSGKSAPAAALRQCADELAIAACHAKVYCLTPIGRGVSYVLTGSANLTTNPRLEVAHVSAQPELVAFYHGQLKEAIERAARQAKAES